MTQPDTSDQKRIQVIFQKALASNSVREKNAYLNELKRLFKKHAADYAQAVQEGERLDGAIAQTRQQYAQLNEEYEALKLSVAFLNELEFYQAAPDVASMKHLIRSIEHDILAIAPLADRDLLDQTHDYVDLLDLRETRLRQLVEAFRARIKTAEQRLDCASIVIDEFGSITNLLDRVRSLKEENARLRVRQVRFNRDSLLKPRRLTRCSPATLRAYLVALQNELAIARREVAEAQARSEASLAEIPVSADFLTDTNLRFGGQLPPLVHGPLDLDPATITAITEGIVGPESPEVELVQLDNEFAVIKERTQRLRSELTLRRTAERIAGETGKARVEKLHSLNERLLSEIHTLQAQHEAAEATRSALGEMLEEVKGERAEMEAKSARLAEEYKKLFEKHLALREEFKRVWRAGAGLFRLTELFGKAYLAQILEPSEFACQVAAFTPIVGDRAIPYFTEQPPPVLMKFFVDVHAELVRRRAAAAGVQVEECHDELLKEVVDVVEQAPAGVFQQLSEQGRVRAVFDELLVGIRSATQRDVEQVGQFLREGFTQLRDASEAILCKVKRAMSTQTFQARKNDIETQYNKAEIAKLAKAATKK